MHSNPRILIVDDHADGLQMLGALLRTLGCEVRTCADGLGCVEQAAAFQPQGILLDLAIPGQDGFEIAERLRCANLPRFELVAMSGYCDPLMRERCQQAGFNRFLAKPLSLEDLERFLADIVTVVS